MSGWGDARIRNLLVVRLDNIGDVVMLGPALRAVKTASPATRITLLASHAGATAVPLLPWIDDVIIWRSVWQDLGQLPFDPPRELELIELLRRRGFDAAIIFTSFSQTPHAPGYVCYLAGIPLRAGDSTEFGGATLTTELRGEAPQHEHQVERNLRLVEALGFPADDRRLQVEITDAERERASFLLERAGIDPTAPYAIVHPGASAVARRYPAERYGAVATLLHARGYQVLVTGSERERDLVETVVRHALPTRVHALSDTTTLGEYAAILERTAVLIANNSLPLHLADALLTPIVVLFSGTDLEEHWRPRYTPAAVLRIDTPCHPCHRFDCPIGLPCLDIDPETVVAAAEDLIGMRTTSSARAVPA